MNANTKKIQEKLYEKSSELLIDRHGDLLLANDDIHWLKIIGSDYEQIESLEEDELMKCRACPIDDLEEDEIDTLLSVLDK